MSPPIITDRTKSLILYLIILILILSSLPIIAIADQNLSNDQPRGLPRPPGQKDVEVIKEVDVAPPGGYWQGSVYVPMLLFGLRAKQTAEDMNWVNITHIGSGPTSDIPKVTLFENTNTNKHFEPGVYDTKITSCNNWTTQGYMNIPFEQNWLIPSGGAGLQIWVVYDFSGTALGKHGVEISTVNDIQGPVINVVDGSPPFMPLQSSIIGINLTSDYTFQINSIQTFDLEGAQCNDFYSMEMVQIWCNVSHTWGKDAIYSANVTIKDPSDKQIAINQPMLLDGSSTGPVWKKFRYNFYLPNPSPRGQYNATVKVGGYGKYGVLIFTTTWDFFTVINEPPKIKGVIPDQYRREDEIWSLNLQDNKTDREDDNADLYWSVTSIESPIDHVNVTGDLLTFHLKKNKFGSDKVELHLIDSDGGSTWTTFWVNIKSVNDKPTIFPPIPDQIKDEDSPDWSIDLSGRMSDPEDPLFGLEWSVWGAFEDLYSAEIEGNFLRFSLVPDAFGDDILFVNLTDSDGMTTTQKVNISIVPDNDKPIWKPIETVVVRNLEVQNALNFESYIEDIDTEAYNIDFYIDPYEHKDQIDVTVDENNNLDIKLRSTDYTCLITVLVTADDGDNVVKQSFKIFATVENLETSLITPPDGGKLSTKSPQLSWHTTIPSAFKNYDVKYSLYFSQEMWKVEDLNSTVLLSKHQTSESFIPDSPLTNGTTYYWTVIPILLNSYNEVLLEGECLSGVREFIVDLSASNEPPTSHLKSPENQTLIMDTSVLLSWEGFDPNGDTPLFYTLYFGTDFSSVADHDDSAEVKDLENPMSKSYFVTNLTEDTTYFWTVIPSDGREDGFCIHNVWQFGVSLDRVPPETTLNYPENGMYVTVSPELFWTVEDPDAGETIKYYIYLSDDYNKVETHDGSVLYRNRGFFDNYLRISPNLQSDTLYYWTVIPEDNLGKGTCTSGIWSFTTSEGYINSLPRVNLLSPNNGVTIGETEVELRWNGTDDDEDDVLKYMVYFSTNREMVQKYDFTALFDTVTGTTSIKISYLQNGTVYYWAVIPNDGKQNGLCLDGSRYFKINIMKEQVNGPPPDERNVTQENNFEDLMVYIILAIIVLVVVILVGAVVLRKGGKKRKSKGKKDERVEVDEVEEDIEKAEEDIEEKEEELELESEPSKPEPPSVILPEPILTAEPTPSTLASEFPLVQVYMPPPTVEETSKPIVMAKPVASTLAAEFPLEQAYRAPAEEPKPIVIAKAVEKPEIISKPKEPSVDKQETPVIATPVPKVEPSTLAAEYPLEQKYSPPPEPQVVPKPSVVAPEPEPEPHIKQKKVIPKPKVMPKVKPKLKPKVVRKIKPKIKPKVVQKGK